MAEAARRFREAGGSDIVRRLIARPIRLDPPRPVDRLVVHEAPAAEMHDAGFEATPDAQFHDASNDEAFEHESEVASDDSDVVEGLRAEMALMKAILMAERAETAALRARIGQETKPEALGAEVRATSERWASMVDRLLIAAR